MVNETTISFISKFDPNGANAAVAGNQKVAQSLDGLSQKADGTGRSMEGLFHKLARPLEVVAFSGVANELVGMGQNGETAGQMIEHGLHAAGEALMFFNPLLGISVIAGTALWEVFEKINNSTKLTGEQIKKIIDANTELAKSYRSAADEAAKTGERSDVVRALAQLADATDRDTQNTKDNAKARLDSARALLMHINATKAATLAEEQGEDPAHGLYLKAKQGAAAQKEYTEALKAYAEVLAETAAVEKKGEMTEDEKNAVLDKQKDIVDKLRLASMDLAKVKSELLTLTTREKVLEEEIQNTTDPKKLKELETEYDLTMKMITLDKQRETELTSSLKTGQNFSEGMQKAYNDLFNTLESGVDISKKVLQKMMDDQIKIIGDGLIKQLSAKATASLADPLTVGIGLAELAAMSAVAAITGGSGGGASAPSAASSNLPTQGQNGQGGVPQVNLTFVQQGTQMGKYFVSNFVDEMNAFSQNNNGMVIATHYISPNGQVLTIGQS